MHRVFAVLVCPAPLFLWVTLAAGEPVQFDCTPANCPTLVIEGDAISRLPNGQPAGFRGFADPCVRKDPENHALWMVYSWPHVEYVGGGSRDFVVGVETHLASSADGGVTWRRTGVLWPKTPARYGDVRTRIPVDGFVSHEVPNIAPILLDGTPAWVGVRLDYFLGRSGNYQARNPRSFCLRLMTATSPAALTNATPVTFGIAENAPECRVDVNLHALSDDFPLRFIPNEPAVLFKDGRLYLAFVVMAFSGQKPDFPQSFIAVLSTVPRGGVRSWTWRYHGKLAGHGEASALGGESLTQIELALGQDGRLLALLTPEAWDVRLAQENSRDPFFGIVHRGVAIVEVASLDSPALGRRPDGRLAERAILAASQDGERGPGAAAYDPASATGVVFTRRDIVPGKSLSWSLHPTRVHP